MRIFLCGISALQWWARAQTRGVPSACVGKEALVDCAPTARSVQHVFDSIPFLTKPLCVLVPTDAGSRTISNVVTHVSSFDYGELSFVRVGDGVYVSSPELCFMQVALSLGFQPAVKAGYMLCGMFYEEYSGASEGASAPAGLGRRRPITTTRDLWRYVAQNAGLRGVSKAKEVLPHVVDGSASPRESDLAMRLMLPGSRGGFGLEGARLNWRIDYSAYARSLARSPYCVADMCWPKEKLVVEYDSDLHLTSEYIAHDAIKRSALEEDGYKVIGVTKLQLDDIGEMHKVARQVAKRLGKRLRTQSVKFEERQRALFQLR